MSTGMIFYRDASLGPTLLRRSVVHNAVVSHKGLSWRDGSLQDRIIWVVICRRRCWFFDCVCCRVRVRPPAATDPPGISWALALSLSLSRFSVSPRWSRDGWYFFISSYFAVELVLLSLPLYPDIPLSRHFPYSISSRISQGSIPRKKEKDNIEVYVCGNSLCERR